MDDFPARLVIVPASATDCSATGWETPTRPRWTTSGPRLDDAGVPYKEGTADELADRRVE